MSIYNSGLYIKTKLTDAYIKEIVTFVKDACAVDFYCALCKKEKTFTQVTNRLIFIGNGSSGYVFDQAPTVTPNSKEVFTTNSRSFTVPFFVVKEFICPSCKSSVTQIFEITKEHISKIGENPSYFNTHQSELASLKDCLEKDDFEILKKAELLAGFGYYIGAVTYLRRIFESVVMTVFTKNKTMIGIYDDDFVKLRIADKIEKIREYLPKTNGTQEMFKKDSKLYSVLSDGVHNLPEDECKEIYPFVKHAITIILTDIKKEAETTEFLRKYKK